MDANISEIVVVLDKRWEDNMEEAVVMLRQVGVQIMETDDDTSVVKGQIDSIRLCELEKLECVDYVRRVFSYEANYPPGDPRDRDGM